MSNKMSFYYSFLHYSKVFNYFSAFILKCCYYRKNNVEANSINKEDHHCLLIN